MILEFVITGCISAICLLGMWLFLKHGNFTYLKKAILCIGILCVINFAGGSFVIFFRYEIAEGVRDATSWDYVMGFGYILLWSLMTGIIHGTILFTVLHFIQHVIHSVRHKDKHCSRKPF